MVTSIAGMPVRNTANLIDKDTRICALLFADGGYGKTTFAATLNELTLWQLKKPTLFIAVEAGEGGGTMSIQNAGVDFVCPTNLAELKKIIAWLATDTTYGGVVFDSGTEYVNRFVKPYALKFPSRENVQTRTAGVPERSDYQTMGEVARQDFNALINLTVDPNLEIRKHLLITALRKDKEEKGTVVSIGPDLPGALAGAAVAMFQTIGTIKIDARVEKNAAGQPTRVNKRVFMTTADGVWKVKDRTNIFPPLADELNFNTLYQKYWMPKFAEPAAAA